MKRLLLSLFAVIAVCLTSAVASADVIQCVVVRDAYGARQVCTRYVSPPVVIVPRYYGSYVYRPYGYGYRSYGAYGGFRTYGSYGGGYHGGFRGGFHGRR